MVYIYIFICIYENVDITESGLYQQHTDLRKNADSSYHTFSKAQVVDRDDVYACVQVNIHIASGSELFLSIASCRLSLDLSRYIEYIYI